MQEPRIVGIAIGLVLIVLGVWLGRSAVGEKSKGRVFSYVTFIYTGSYFLLQHVFFGFRETWTWKGVQSVWVGMIAGGPLVVVMFSAIYFAFGSRAPGYAIILLFITGLMMLGNSA